MKKSWQSAVEEFVCPDVQTSERKAETCTPADPGGGCCPLTFDHIVYLLENSSVLTSSPFIRLYSVCWTTFVRIVSAHCDSQLLNNVLYIDIYYSTVCSVFLKKNQPYFCHHWQYSCFCQISASSREDLKNLAGDTGGVDFHAYTADVAADLNQRKTTDGWIG